MRPLFLAVLIQLLFSHVCIAQSPVFDMHTHYKWSQREVTTPEQAIEALDKNGITHAVVIGKPPKLALELKAKAPDRLVAFFSPYRESLDWFRWQRDEKVLVAATEAIESGQYQGIGELHIIGGFAMKKERAKVLNGLMALAKKHDVPIMLHTEFSRPGYMLEICKHHPETRIIWAHAGAILKPADVDKVMQACPNVWAGMGARDPWRFVNHPHTNEDGQLLSAWKALFLKYPDRFMVGSDTVWPVDQMDSWDQADTGWQELGRFWTFHRDWLSQLPESVARKIAHENALTFFGFNQ
jgi:predicted TIM-barrel fold metal-dependent hydrolase